MNTKPSMALLTLLLLLFLPYTVLASGTGTVKIIGADGTVRPNIIETPANSSKDNQSSNTISIVQNESSNSNSGSDPDDGLWEKGIKGVKSAVSDSLQGFTYWAIDQLMLGSINIYEADADITNGKLETDENGDSKVIEDVSARTVTYQMNTKIINPFAPSYALKALLVTGGFYICEIFLVIIGSIILLMFYIDHPEQYVDFIASFTGEEKPYTMTTMTVASVGAMSYWIIALTIIFIITGCRNLLIYTMTGHAITLPMMYSDDFATYLLTAVSLYSSSFQTAMAEYGIYMIVSLTFVTGGITGILLMFGAYKKAVSLNIIVWGSYSLCNIVDLIITGSIAAGIGTYQLTGNPIFVTVGIVFAACVNFVILAVVIIYAIFAGKQILIQRIYNNNMLPGGGMY